MNLFESKYWKLTVFLQRIIGLWPLQESPWKNYAAWIYVYRFTASLIIALGVRLYNELGVHVDIVIENSIGELYAFFVVYKLTYSLLRREKLKSLYQQVANDWKIIKDVEELRIMHKYVAIGLKIIRLYSAYIILGVAMFLMLPVFFPILDCIIPLENATRPKSLPYYAEYGVDIQEYYYPLIAQAIFGGTGTILFLATFDLGFMSIVQHVVAIFKLVNLNLSKAAEIAATIENDKNNFVHTDCIARRYLMRAVELHKKSIHYVNIIENYYTMVWVAILFVNVAFIGGGMTIVLMKSSRLEESFRYSLIVGASFMHFYYVFLPGQKIINATEDIFYDCFACKWYNLSEKSKVLVKVMMLRSSVRCELTGGKLFVLCMETYCNMIKTGYTIFTILNT